MEAKLLVPKLVLLACLLFCISNQGRAAGCDLSNIVFSQAGTRGWAHGQPEYAVTVKNTCSCPQSQVMVACDGFKTNQIPDLSKFQPVGGDGKLCLVNNGYPVVQGRDVTFNYAWTPQFNFVAVSWVIQCR